MPNLIRHPERIEITGFRLEFIPHLMRGRNDGKKHLPTFNECIRIEYGQQFSSLKIRQKGAYVSLKKTPTMPLSACMLLTGRP